MKFTREQITFALRQAEVGAPVTEVPPSISDIDGAYGQIASCGRRMPHKNGRSRVGSSPLGLICRISGALAL